MGSIDKPSIDSLLYIVTFKTLYEVMIPLNMHAVCLMKSGTTVDRISNAAVVTEV
jgi:hypothetical protein